MELYEYIEKWFGLQPADMAMFNTREKNRYIRMLVEDHVFEKYSPFMRTVNNLLSYIAPIRTKNNYHRDNFANLEDIAYRYLHTHIDETEEDYVYNLCHIYGVDIVL